MDEKELRKYLLGKLPKYMVPNVQAAPLTAYVAPVTEIEKNVCRAMEEVSNYSPIGLQHDFFENGGDSLKAIKLIVKLEGMGFKPKLQDLFDHSVVGEFIKVLQHGTEEKVSEDYNEERFIKYEPILAKNRICADYNHQETPIKTVLLSGITGFLGAHIADALLQDEDCKAFQYEPYNFPCIFKS